MGPAPGALVLVWTAEGDQASARFGSSIASAGDVNGDGFDDLVVGAFLYDGGLTDEGRAELYLGSNAGPETLATWTAESDQESAWFGSAVAGVGDVDGDGLDDVLVGANLYDDGSTDEGAAFLYRGSSYGLETTPAWTLEPDLASTSFGAHADAAGDVDGDGYADVIVGATGFDGGQANEGAAFVFLGSAAGLETAAVWSAPETNQTYAGSGIVATAGDVNGDGFADVAVGSPNYDAGASTQTGSVSVYHGSAAGPSPEASWITHGDGDYVFLGRAVAGGDINGDGYGDLVVGGATVFYNYYYYRDGSAYVFLGAATGLAGDGAAWSMEIDQFDDRFGSSVAAADLNHDGYDDVVVGGPGYWNPDEAEGAVWVYDGSSTGPAAEPSWVAEGEQFLAYFGSSLSAAGDLNGDGRSDLVVAAELSGTDDEGIVYAYLAPCIDPLDSDGDGVGDSCDRCEGFDDALDTDLDEVADGCDVCPEVSDATQDDGDGDGVGDVCDPCPVDAPDDADADGWCASEDCDDLDATAHPDAPDAPCDGVDSDCLGDLPEEGSDGDGDGTTDCDGDCDDVNPFVHPAAEERCNNTVDDNCDGLVDEVDADADGSSACGEDCDDSDPAAHPGMAELCDDATDNDCNGLVDDGCSGPPVAPPGGCGCAGSGLGGLQWVATVFVFVASRHRIRRVAVSPPDEGC